MEFLQQHFIELIALIVSILAFFVSLSAKHYAEKAFSLSLFDKRYKLYDDFKNALSKIIFYRDDAAFFGNASNL